MEDELAIGDPVKIKILRIIPDEQKIGLSIKRVNEEIIAPVSNEEKHKLPAIEKESNESSSAYTSPNSPRNKTSMADAFDKLSDAS